MSDHSFEIWQERLTESTRAFVYPPTPDIASAVTKRLAESTPRQMKAPLRLVWASALVLVLVFSALISVPGVRAAIVEFLQLGAIRIFLAPPTPTPTSQPTTDALVTPGSANPRPAITPTPTPVYLTSILDLAGETTLENAIQQAGFELGMPTYPEGLGLPQRVFLQDMDGAVVVFIWLVPDGGDEVLLSLFQIGPGSWAGEKGIPERVESTRVKGEPALWTQGPYPLVLRNNQLDFRRLVDGNVLIWYDNGITYRLEGRFDLGEAVKIAESIALLP